MCEGVCVYVRVFVCESVCVHICESVCVCVCCWALNPGFMHSRKVCMNVFLKFFLAIKSKFMCTIKISKY